jgi:hypothetical protein
MGAAKNEYTRLGFDRRLALEFHGAKISSDAGLLAYREMDEVLGLTSMSGHLLNDWRTGKNTQHSMLALIRQSIYSRSSYAPKEGHVQHKARMAALEELFGRCSRDGVVRM